MIDLIYLTFNRIEFTRASMAALLANTDFSQVSRIIIYDDGSEDGTREYLGSIDYPAEVKFVFRSIGGPVSIMNHYLRNCPSEIFAKIDNDTMVPPFWLNECLNVMESRDELGLLGIEAFNPVKSGQAQRGYTKARWIGGIGLMRSSCFTSFPRPNGRFGFTQWQRESRAIKGWINPSLQVFLLDKMPMEPWISLSKEYIAKGLQRKWPLYGNNDRVLWEWWKR